jgi:hypothetical protein
LRIARRWDQQQRLHPHIVDEDQFVDKFLIHAWYDRKILPGENWKEAIDMNLNRANLILLLVSPTFLASNYCVEIEFKRAIERHRAGDALVIPLILRSCQWKDEKEIASLQVLPADGVPIAKWEDRDECYNDIVTRIRRTIEERFRTA